VVAPTSTQPGSARDWSRAARFGVSPTTVSWPCVPTHSVETTIPVAIPTRHCSSYPSLFTRPVCVSESECVSGVAYERFRKCGETFYSLLACLRLSLLSLARLDQRSMGMAKRGASRPERTGTDVRIKCRRKNVSAPHS